MEALIIIVGLAVLIAIVIAFLGACAATNQSCVERYDYKPINGGTVFFSAIAMSGMAGGAFLIDSATAKAQLNGIVLVAFGLLIGAGVFLRLVQKTSILHAILAGVLLTIIGSLSFLALAIAIIVAIAASENPRRKVVVVRRN